jgi:tRNA wybutosine-synthesizing protein 2
MGKSKRCSITCIQKDTKHIKTIFESHGWLDKSKKITKYVSSDPYCSKDEKNLSVIPTKLSVKHLVGVMSSTMLMDYIQDILPNDANPDDKNFDVDLQSLWKRSPLHRGLIEWTKIWQFTCDSTDEPMEGPPFYKMLQDLPTSYTVYPPMLLLSPGSLSSDVWETYLRDAAEAEKMSLLNKLAGAVNCTHIAINAHIPGELHAESSEKDTQKTSDSNEIRFPVNLTPMLGDFGPAHCTADPTTTDFDCAFWVQVLQNGIKQTWAPRHSMFSRGNVKEKARLLDLVPRTTPSAEGEFTAVDLFAGIGYFAFSYAKAGASKVLCWDINGWSVEGLRRGASLNGWTTNVMKLGDCSEDYDRSMLVLTTRSQNSKLLVFHEDNRSAPFVISHLEAYIPPVRHVNCGLLPTSKASWKIAVEAISKQHGGWIHLHENIRTDQIVQISADICLQIQKLLNEARGPDSELRIKLDHIEKVKSYAPGVKHCVLDIFIPPMDSDENEEFEKSSDIMEMDSETLKDSQAED